MWYRFSYPEGHSWAGLEEKAVCPVCNHEGLVLETSNSANSYGLRDTVYGSTEPDRARCPNCGVILDHETVLRKADRKTAEQPV